MGYKLCYRSSRGMRIRRILLFHSRDRGGQENAQMNAAAVLPRKPKGPMSEVVKMKWFIAAMAAMVLIFGAAFTEMFTSRGGENTGIVSELVMGPAWVDQQVHAHEVLVDDSDFYQRTKLQYFNPQCADPDRWKVMSQQEHDRWHTSWVVLNARNEAEARRQRLNEKDFNFYFRLEGTEHCYISMKKKLE